MVKIRRKKLYPAFLFPFSIDGFAVGAHPVVIRFLKGVYYLRAPSSKYCDTWDVSMVMKYLKQLSPVSELNLKLLTLKLAMLIHVALTTAARSQSLHLLTIDNMIKNPSKYILCYCGLLNKLEEGLNLQLQNFVVIP